MATAIDCGAADPAWVAASVAHIGHYMRQQDLDELASMHDIAPELVLSQSLLLSSHAWIAEHKGEPVAIFGAAPSPLPGVGIVWLLGTDKITEAGRSIARQTPHYVEQMQRAYPVLWNYIDARNSVSMRWLRWGGFKLVGDYTSPKGHPFHIFARTAHV